MKNKMIFLVYPAIILGLLLFINMSSFKGDKIDSINPDYNLAFSQTFTLTHDTVKREYLVHVPESYNGSVKVPLVIALHGLGSTIQDMENLSGLSKKSETEGFIVVYPKGISNGGWNQDTIGTNDIGFISDMLDTLFINYKIDTNCVYATGFSIGGGMCYRIAQELSDRIAAIAPVAAWVGSFTSSPWIDYNLSTYTVPKRPIPIIQFNSKDDDYYKAFWAINYWVDNNKCLLKPDTLLNSEKVIAEIWRSSSNKGDVILYSAPSGGHDWPNVARIGYSATDTMWVFFKKYKK